MKTIRLLCIKILILNIIVYRKEKYPFELWDIFHPIILVVRKPAALQIRTVRLRRFHRIRTRPELPSQLGYITTLQLTSRRSSFFI